MADLPIKALSVRQPWAWAIINAGRDVENRNWTTKFRGPVCIHAGNYLPQQSDVDTFNQLFQRAIPDELERARIGGRFFEARSMQRGGIIGVAEIVDCVDSSASPWFMGRYGFVLANARPVPFIPVKGALSFFDWGKRTCGNAP